MESEKHGEMSSNLELYTIKNGFEWLSTQQIESRKELASIVSAHASWGLPNPHCLGLSSSFPIAISNCWLHTYVL